MRKNFGSKTWMYPMPVLIIGTYDENGNANAMNAAWGGIYEENQVIICLSEGHKTYKNIQLKKEFTISFADADHVAACDYVGIESGNKIENKLEKAGFTTTKSEFIDAPIINELPMCLECRLVSATENGNLIADIINVNADEKILDKSGKIDPALLKPICYDPVNHYYHVLGEKVGNAFSDGKVLK